MKFKFEGIRSDQPLLVEYLGGTSIRINFVTYDVQDFLFDPYKPPVQMVDYLTRVDLVDGEYVALLVYPYGYGQPFDSFEVEASTPTVLFDNRS